MGVSSYRRLILAEQLSCGSSPWLILEVAQILFYLALRAHRHGQRNPPSWVLVKLSGCRPTMIISPKLSATSRRHNGVSGSKRAELSAEGLRVLTAWTPRERSES